MSIIFDFQPILWYSIAWSYETLRWAIFRPYYSTIDAYFQSEFSTPHPDSKAILGHWKSLMCKSKVEGALPPHLKSWVGTCPHCPHGSYATGSAWWLSFGLAQHAAYLPSWTAPRLCCSILGVAWPMTWREVGASLSRCTQKTCGSPPESGTNTPLTQLQQCAIKTSVHSRPWFRDPQK